MTIQEQIEALTQELRPYPKEIKLKTNSSGDLIPIAATASPFWYIEHGEVWRGDFFGTKEDKLHWLYSPFASTNKAEVEEYADCYRRLKLYQLLGKKAEKEFPFISGRELYGTDFVQWHDDPKSLSGYKIGYLDMKRCVLGGVWFSREEDRLEALKICGITKEFQEKMSKYGLGGA